MSQILTNFGHRYIADQLKFQSEEKLKTNLPTRILLQVLKEKIFQGRLTDIHRSLITQGFVNKLHANNKVKDYLKYLDKKIFGEYYDHICSIRAILTLLAKNINSDCSLTPDAIFEIKKIARYSGYGGGI